MVSAILGGLALAGGAVNGIMSAVRNKQAQEEENRRHDDAVKYYKSEISADPTTRADNLALLTNQRNILADEYRKARARSIVGGASEDSVAMQKELANASMANTMQNIAVTNEARKDKLREMLLGEDSAHSKAVQGIAQANAQQNAAASSQAFSAGANMLSSYLGNKPKIQTGGTNSVG